MINEDTSGLLFGCLLDGNGTATLLGWEDFKDWKQGDGHVWLHLDGKSEKARKWLLEDSGLSEATTSALLADETRPRTFMGKTGTILILRGVNTNAGSDPEDMVAIRIWCDGHRVITLRNRKLMTPRDILEQLTERGDGPTNIPELFVGLVGRLTDRMASMIVALDDDLGELEESLESTDVKSGRTILSRIRQEAVTLRRYLSPQREALGNLLSAPPKWLAEHHRFSLRESADKTVRYVEELDAVRERSVVIKDDLANRMAENTNRTLYVLAIISALFLPLGFLTGLLGINVGGMPGTDSSNAFWIVVAAMTFVAAVELWIFKKMGWL